MPFRPTFDCLWCGSPHATRATSDIEGWAQLCPDCIGRAGANPFLASRLRQALADRSRAAPVAPVVSAAPAPAAPVAPVVSAAPAPAAPVAPATPDEVDDRYLRRGRFARGPIHDAAWDAELDAAGRWLDALPIAGEIVELAAGTGWWSALLAGKGTLSAYDESPARLDRALARLVAHRLRAHLHVRDRWAEPDRAVQALFVGPGIAEIPSARLNAFADLARRWLTPGGQLAVIDLLPDALVAADVGPGSSVAAPSAAPASSDPASSDPASPASGSAEPAHAPGALSAALVAAGFKAVRAEATGRFFALVQATA